MKAVAGVLDHIEGLRELTLEEQCALAEFERKMRDEVIPEIVETMFQREEAWQRYIRS